MMYYQPSLASTHEARQLPSSLGATVDPAAVTLAYGAALALRGQTPGLSDVAALLIMLLLAYPGRVPFRALDVAIARRIVLRWALPTGILGAFVFLTPMELARNDFHLDIGVWALWSVLSLATLLGLHAAAPAVWNMARSTSRASSVVIVGVSQPALEFGALVSQGRAGLCRLAGYFDDRSASRLDMTDPASLRGGLADVGDYVKTHRVTTVYIALPMHLGGRVDVLLQQLRDTTACVYFLPELPTGWTGNGRFSTVAGSPVLAVCETRIDGWGALAKRMLDIALTLLASPVLATVMALVAVAIKASSPGPALFRQRRHGLNGEVIMVWKFRTMFNVEDGTTHFRAAGRNDDRVTPIGRFLRRTSLDELPQFLNVLEGSMSVVGPRPHAVAMNENLRPLIPGYMQRHMVRPGITGWAQVHGLRGGADLESVRKRTEYDLEYLRSWSIALDFLIIVKTVPLLLKGDAKAY